MDGAKVGAVLASVCLWGCTNPETTAGGDMTEGAATSTATGPSSGTEGSNDTTEGAADTTGGTASNDEGSESDGSTGDELPPCTAPEVDGRLVHGPASPLVDIDPTCGRLTYGQYANQGQADAVHVLPDFSFAGYMQGGVALPDVPTVVTLSAAPGDNRSAIQAAIDEVSAMEPDADGFRGAVLLSAGTYEVDDTLTIAASGVVLRGEGQGSDGTILVATRPEQHDLIVISNGSGSPGEVPDTRVAITSELIPVGARSLEVADGSGFSEGDTVRVIRTPNQTWIDDLDMAQWGWTPEAYEIGFERTITAVEGNTLTLDIPIVDAIESQYGGGAVARIDTSNRVEQSGVEDLRLDSEYQSADDESHGWNAITVRGAANSWVRRVTALHFGYAATNLVDSSFITVEEVAQLDPISQITGGRRYSFNISGRGTGNLFNRCFAREGRHNFVTGSRVPGPHVWLDSLSIQNNNDEGPHHRWSTGLLFDNTSSALFNAQNRADSGSGHGWAGAQTLFWNIRASSTVVSDAPHAAMNWVVGGDGTQADSSFTPDEPDGWWESWQSTVTPRSLYLAQLEDRLGPDAVANVTIPEQLEGDIWSLLQGWAGEGLLADARPEDPVVCMGILSGSGAACCPDSCGACGGAGCSGLPGGADNCCEGTIIEADQSCAEFPPPCVMP